MDTDRWRCWCYTDHQGTLIISALMIFVHVPSEESCQCDGSWGEKCISLCISLFTCDQL
ncbi:unnamed protein product [Staurois parvus]|uniref:Uncharacterized protein n=1 Tax=Staurois parvus TaxID=386267 RepID=A0ABN9DZP0_9NEOB|nr:unnamed protein product [Staurois parvus]